MRVRMHACRYVCTYAWIHVCMYNASINPCVIMHLWMYEGLKVWVHGCMHACTYVCTSVASAVQCNAMLMLCYYVTLMMLPTALRLQYFTDLHKKHLCYNCLQSIGRDTEVVLRIPAQWVIRIEIRSLLGSLAKCLDGPSNYVCWMLDFKMR